MTDGYGQWAQHYRSRLWTGVLPLPPRQKTPPPGGYTGRGGKTPTDEQIAAWSAKHADGNLALRMPSDIIGIDVDAYEYEFKDQDGVLRQGVKTGDQTLWALEAELGPLPATWRSSARGDGPSGIRWFRVPPGLLWHDVGLHTELIWWGHRYAIVWPSVHPDTGQPYLWIDETTPEGQAAWWGPHIPKVTDPADLPESWVQHLSLGPPDAPSATPRPRRATAGVWTTAGDFQGPGGEARQFTRKQAGEFVQPLLDALRAATPGEINNRLNDAAKTMSHFIPVFWSHAAANALILDALSGTAYDGRTWKAEMTIRSAFDSSLGDWAAALVDQPIRPARTKEHPTRAPHVATEDTEEPPEYSDGGDGPQDAPEDEEAARQAEEDFWSSRIILGHIHDYATAKYAAPWAVLGSVLARVAAAVEPNIQLPASIGTEASLNLYVALVGTSGGGKDIAFGVAERALDIWSGQDPLETDIIPLGSGEGLSHIYMKYPPKLTKRKPGADDDDSAMIGLTGTDPDKPIQYRTRALVTITEIDTLEAIGQRRGSTLGGQLRQAWNGGQIGFQYVDVMKRMIVPKHAYRMCLVASIQPGRAAALMAEADGGTPQRFLWLPANNPGMDRVDLTAPNSMGWEPPHYGGSRVLFEICDGAIDAVIDNHIKRNRGEGDALDGHSVLNRLKVAAALAMLDVGRSPKEQLTVTPEDWHLAGVIQAVSDRTRAGVVRHLADAAKVENEKKAYVEARKTIVISETVEDDGLKKVVRWLRGKIVAEWVTEQWLRSKIRGNQKRFLSDALDTLASGGEIEIGEYVANNGTARQVRRRGPSDG